MTGMRDDAEGSLATHKSEARWLRVSDVARLFGVSDNTVRRWTDAGKVRTHRSPGGHRRYLSHDIMEQLNEGSPVSWPGAPTGASPGSEHREHELRAIVELSQAAALTNNLEDLVALIGMRLLEITGSADCDIWRVFEGNIVSLGSFEPNGPDSTQAGRVLDLAKYPMTVKALRANAPYVVSSLDDPRLTPLEAKSLSDWGYGSEFVMPLVINERKVGFVDIFDVRERDYAEHFDIVTSAGQILAAALEKTLLLERLEAGNRDLHLLVDSGVELGTSLDVDRVLEVIAERMCTVTETDFCDIYGLADGRIHTLVAVGHQPATGEKYPTGPIGVTYEIDDYNIFKRALKEKQPVAIRDLRNDPGASDTERAEAMEFDFRAELVIPLVVNGEVVGFATVYDDRLRDFNDLGLAQGLAQIAAGALANANLFRQLGEQNARLESLLEAGRATASTLVLDDVLSIVTRTTATALNSPECVIFVYDKDDDTITLRAMHEDEVTDYDGLGDPIPLSESPVDKSILERGVILEESISDPKVDPDSLASMERYGEKTCLNVPLKFGDEPLGILVLIETERERHFSPQELEFVRALSDQAATAIHNARLYDDIKRMHLNNLKALGAALNAKDFYTLGHAARVSGYMVLLGQELGWPGDFIEQAEEAAYLHDIGKIGISDRVLLKPGKLNTQEWDVMRSHPVLSADIIRSLFAEDLVLGVRHHHERYDGKGYPDGLAGTQIPLIARAMCVVDSYDAMSYQRPYKMASNAEQCLEELDRCSGVHFDPKMVEAFLRVLDRLETAHRKADAIAEEAANRIDGDMHRLLRLPDDELRPEYREIADILRHARDANPPTRYVTTVARFGDKYAIVVDAETELESHSRLGEEVDADHTMPGLLAGIRPSRNTLVADEYGVWISGVATICDAAGEIIAAVNADLPAIAGARIASLAGDRKFTPSGVLRSTAVRLSRTEIDTITDGLTGIYNHRYLHDRLKDEIARSEAHDAALSVLFCDLDNFKVFNERVGHSVGDQALRSVAHILEQSIRDVDLVARFGGEEFVVVLVETPKEGAILVAERIREKLEAAVFPPSREPLTMSIGVASYPEDGSIKEELLDRADWAKRLAKRRGRNMVLPYVAAEADEEPVGETVV
jgi:diguanylate cyclase (GGDEF)-like protein/excisionase family DNA binding protein